MASFGDKLTFNEAINEAIDKSLARTDLSPQLANFHFSTLVINGRFDMNVAVITAWKLYHKIPNAKVSIFSKSGHFPFYEEPDKFVQVVSDFINAT
jgi:proline iminopeptidase